MAALTTTLFTELLQSVGHARIEVLGSSMLPVIHPGDILQVESSPAHPGDIIVFNNQGLLCAHRLLTVIDGRAIARGDANRRLDTPFPIENALGRVNSLNRGGVVIEDLKFRPWASFFIRNSSLFRRGYLRFLSIRRGKRIFGSVETNPSLSKQQA